DIRMNLAAALAAAAEALGSSERDRPSPHSAFALSAPEAWWLSAALIAFGAIAGVAAAFRPSGRALARVGMIATACGVLLWGGLLLRAREEAWHPQAVVVVPLLSVGPAPDERPRPPYLLGAGEQVRLGRIRGDLVEIRVGGNAVGWAQRSGLWRVTDAARYTSKSTSQ
ncbi:MAG: hypothetical protein HY568_02320, partial [Candidatus Latescibacteria bacterium]|nr:hypothetical protein [Candidatus Latescibacterota bacterium]